MGTHSAFGEGSHTTAHTPKQEPSLSRPQCGFVLSVKFLLFHHAFIYIHFPVLCEPSTPADEKKSAKLPSQFYLRPPLVAFFSLSHKRPTFAFMGKNGYTLGFRRRIAHKGLHAETGGRFGWGCYHYPRTVSHVSETLRGRVSERQTLPLSGLGRGALPENAESLRNSDALMCVAVPRRRGPAGLRDLFYFCRNCGFHALRSGSFRVCKIGGGITTLGVLCVLPKRWMAACQSGSFAVF